MTDPPQFERSAVESADPSLSDEANRRLTRELREIIGRDLVEVPIDRPEPAWAVHGVHGPVVADVLGARRRPDPEAAAFLEAEGVGDPDRLL